MGFEHGELTGEIIAGAIEVHRRLGPGFLEAIYENALVIELSQRRLKVEPQVEVVVEYNGIEVGKHRLDLLVEGTIIVELKAIKVVCSRKSEPEGMLVLAWTREGQDEKRTVH
jgi:GxxExxY protein